MVKKNTEREGKESLNMVGGGDGGGGGFRGWPRGGSPRTNLKQGVGKRSRRSGHDDGGLITIYFMVCVSMYLRVGIIPSCLASKNL